ncbi:MAG: PDZ domain-containing protein [bacterium]
MKTDKKLHFSNKQCLLIRLVVMMFVGGVRLLSSPVPGWSHGGVTPYDVLGKMKRQGTGPYSKIMPNRRISEDWLGIQGEDTGSGVRIVAIKQDGVAEDASFLIGDIIVGIKNQPIRSLDELDAFMNNIRKPEVFTFHYLRDNEESTENIYLDGSLAEVDPEMNNLLKKQGRFKPGMLMDDMMARSPLGNMKKGGFVPPMLRSSSGQGGGTMPMDPASMMRQMMSRTPLGNFSPSPASAPASPPASSLSSFPEPAPSASSLVKGSMETLEKELAQLPHILSRKQEFGLTDRQVRILKGLESERKKFLIRNDSLLAVARMDLQDKLSRNRIDETEALKLVDEVNELKRTRFLKWLELWSRMNKIFLKTRPVYP